MSTTDVKHLADSDLDTLMAQVQAEMNNRQEEKRQQFMDAIDEKAKELKTMAAEVGMTCKIELAVNGRGRGTTIRNKVPPKFRNPENESDLWTGRGNKPHWVVAQLAAGATLDDLLINKD